jgi:protein-tyrosine-phosphatase
VNVLVVCTANICRSPAIEVALRSIALERTVPIEVISAGTHATVGQHADPATVLAAREYGFDLAGHVSQRVRPELVDDADLVLCAEVEHLLTVLSHRDHALSKSFLFLEFVHGVTIRHEQDDPVTWLARVGRHRNAQKVLAESDRYNLRDPHQRGRRRQEDMMRVVAEGADRVVEAIAG